MKYQNLLNLYLEQYRNADRNSKERGKDLGDFLKHCAVNHNNRVDYQSLQVWLNFREKTLGPKRLASLQNRISDFSTWARLLDKSIGRIPKASKVPVYRRKPVILNAEQVNEIIHHGTNCNSKNISSLTFETITGLLFITGMRISEAIGLESTFVDLKTHSIYVPCGKSHRDRIIPISKSTCKMLKAYVEWRNELISDSDLFFVSGNAHVKLNYNIFYNHFVKVIKKAGYRDSSVSCNQRRQLRIHDLRHSFAVNSLIKIYNEGLEVNEAIIQLSSILGHKGLDETYWYIEAVPDLIAAAFKRELS